MINIKDYTIIGIDGGGTKTRGVIFRDGKVQSELVAGTTRIGAVGVGESCERTLNVITELCNKSGIETGEVDAIVVGLAGVWLEEEKLRSRNLIKTLARSQRTVINEILVTSDAEIALEGAFEGKDGIMTIVGTGSIALGKHKNHLYRCGGWGIELDDEGSGAWIGREGLTAVVRGLDGR
ncbi:MAG: BadF/BadG/BcrA/BcrD ATPase family protein, partial [Candidatus Kapaibacterium sp.]